MLAKMSSFCKKHETFLRYVFWGIFASIVNIASYFLFVSIMHLTPVIGNTLAWIVATLFGFSTSKRRVFKKPEATTFLKTMQEAFYFCVFRLASLGADSFTLWFCLVQLGSNALTAKIIANMVSGIMNYLTSKYLVFQNERKLQSMLERYLALKKKRRE